MSFPIKKNQQTRAKDKYKCMCCLLFQQKLNNPEQRIYNELFLNLSNIIKLLMFIH